MTQGNKRMEQKTLMEILVQSRRFGDLMDEVLDLSRQLEDALNRGDQVVIKMLVSMRAEPVRKLKLVDRTLYEQREALSPEDKEHVLGLINGTAEPANAEEELLMNQAAANRRLHQQVLELDKILNRKITRENSFYQ